MAAVQRRLEELKLQLISDEREYNEELKDLVTLTKGCVRWSDPLSTARRRTIATTIQQVKLCSDKLLGDLDQFWYGHLPLDGVYVALGKHFDNCKQFFTYCSHLQELRTVLRSGVRQRPVISSSTFSTKINLERCLLPIYRLREMHAQLQEMMLILATGSSRVELFHCGQSIDQLTQILTKCYKVLTNVNGMDYIKALDELLKGGRKATTSEKNSSTQNHSDINLSQDSEIPMSPSIDADLDASRNQSKSKRDCVSKQNEPVGKKHDKFDEVVQQLEGNVRKPPKWRASKKTPKQESRGERKGSEDVFGVALGTSDVRNASRSTWSSARLQKPDEDSNNLEPNFAQKLKNSLTSKDKSVSRRIVLNKIDERSMLTDVTEMNNNLLTESRIGVLKKSEVDNLQVPLIAKKRSKSLPRDGPFSNPDKAYRLVRKPHVKKHSMRSSKQYLTKSEDNLDSEKLFCDVNHSIENSERVSSKLRGSSVDEKDRLGNKDQMFIRVLPSIPPAVHLKEANRVSVGSGNRFMDLKKENVEKKTKTVPKNVPNINLYLRPTSERPNTYSASPVYKENDIIEKPGPGQEDLITIVSKEQTLTQRDKNDSDIAMDDISPSKLKTLNKNSRSQAHTSLKHTLLENSENEIQSTDKKQLPRKIDPHIPRSNKNKKTAPPVPKKQSRRSKPLEVTELIDATGHSKNLVAESNSGRNVSAKIMFEESIKNSQQEPVQPSLLPKKLINNGSTALLATHIEKMMLESFATNTPVVNNVSDFWNTEELRNHGEVDSKFLPKVKLQNCLSAERPPHIESSNVVLTEQDGILPPVELATVEEPEVQLNALQRKFTEKTSKAQFENFPEETSSNLTSSIQETNSDTTLPVSILRIRFENDQYQHENERNTNFMSSSFGDINSDVPVDLACRDSAKEIQLPAPPAMHSSNVQFLKNLDHQETCSSENSIRSESLKRNLKFNESVVQTQKPKLDASKSSQGPEDSDESFDCKDTVMRQNDNSNKGSPPPLPPKKRKQSLKENVPTREEGNVDQDIIQRDDSIKICNANIRDVYVPFVKGGIYPKLETEEESHYLGKNTVLPLSDREGVFSPLGVFQGRLDASYEIDKLKESKNASISPDSQKHSDKTNQEENENMRRMNETHKKSLVKRNSEYFNNIPKIKIRHKLRHTKSLCDVVRYFITEELPVESKLGVINESVKKTTRSGLVSSEDESGVDSENEMSKTVVSKDMNDVTDGDEQFTEIVKLCDGIIDLFDNKEVLECNSTKYPHYDNTDFRGSSMEASTNSSDFLTFSSMLFPKNGKECSQNNCLDDSDLIQLKQSNDESIEDIYEDVALPEVPHCDDLKNSKDDENGDNQITDQDDIYISMEFSAPALPDSKHGLYRKPSVINNRKTKRLVRSSWKMAPLYQTYVLQSGNSKMNCRHSYENMNPREERPCRNRKKAMTLCEGLQYQEGCQDFSAFCGERKEKKDHEPECEKGAEDEEDEGMYLNMEGGNFMSRFVSKTGVIDYSEEEDDEYVTMRDLDSSIYNPDDENIYESIHNIFAACDEEEKNRKIELKELKERGGDSKERFIVRRQSSHRKCFGWCNIPEVVASGVLDSLSACEKALYEAKYEVITSKVSYLKSLSILQNVFVDSERLTEVLSAEHKALLFGFVAPMKRCSEHFLADLLSGWPHDIFLTDMLTVVQQYATSALDLYIEYCSNRIKMNDTLEYLKKNDKKFSLVLSKLESEEILDGHCLESFLILPVQRVTRIPLLVGSILDRLPPEDKEYQQWKNTLETVQKVTEECNEAVRLAEQKKEKTKELMNLNPKSLTFKRGQGQKRGSWFNFRASKSPMRYSSKE